MLNLRYSDLKLIECIRKMSKDTMEAVIVESIHLCHRSINAILNKLELLDKNIAYLHKGEILAIKYEIQDPSFLRFFDPNTQCLGFDISPDRMTEQYLVCSGKISPGLYFYIQKKNDKYHMKICYRLEETHFCRFISDSLDKIISKVIEASREMNCNLNLSMFILGPEDDEGSHKIIEDGKCGEFPIETYEVYINYYIRLCFEPKKEESYTPTKEHRYDTVYL